MQSIVEIPRNAEVEKGDSKQQMTASQRKNSTSEDHVKNVRTSYYWNQ
jgi:hypothetical protein